jgi:hypothetical protein
VSCPRLRAGNGGPRSQGSYSEDLTGEDRGVHRAAPAWHLGLRSRTRVFKRPLERAGELSVVGTGGQLGKSGRDVDVGVSVTGFPSDKQHAQREVFAELTRQDTNSVPPPMMTKLVRLLDRHELSEGLV